MVHIGLFPIHLAINSFMTDISDATQSWHKDPPAIWQMPCLLEHEAPPACWPEEEQTVWQTKQQQHKCTPKKAKHTH